MPRNSDKQEERDSQAEIKRENGFPSPQQQRPKKDDCAWYREANKSLGQRRQRHAEIKAEQQKSARWPGRFAHAENKKTKRAGDKHGYRHVQNNELAQAEIKQTGAQHDGGKNSGSSSVNPPA